MRPFPDAWMKHPDFDYMVSTHGQVRRYTTSGSGLIAPILTPTPSTNGYMRVFLRRNGKYHTRYVHRLVLETWIGPIEKGKQTNHKDGNKANNRLSNLEVVTSAHNNQHAWDTGLVPRSRNKKTVCSKGHELTPANLVIKHQRNRHGIKVPSRRCRVCLNQNQRNYTKRKAGVGE